MSRIKLICIIVLALLMAIAFFYFKSKNNRVPEKPKEIPNQAVNPNGLVESAKEVLSDKAQESGKDLSNLLEEKKNDLLKAVLGEKSPSVVVNPSPATSTTNENITLLVVDLSQSQTLNLKLKRGIKYLLLFKNVPPQSCLYVQEKSYPIESEKILEVEFKDTGAFTLQTNSCDLNYKNIGQVTVE